MTAKDSAVAPSVIYLKDYKVPPYLVDDVHLDFKLYDDHAAITSTVNYRLNPESETKDVLVLNGKELELLSITLDGTPVAPEHYAIEGEELPQGSNRETKRVRARGVDEEQPPRQQEHGGFVLLAGHVLHPNGSSGFS